MIGFSTADKGDTNRVTNHHQPAWTLLRHYVAASLRHYVTTSQRHTHTNKHTHTDTDKPTHTNTDKQTLLTGCRCTSFTFEHRGCQREFRTTRGIWQGCKAAPTLWTAQAALLLLDIPNATDHTWMTSPQFMQMTATSIRWYTLSRPTGWKSKNSQLLLYLNELLGWNL